jgi:hypothetical protein
LSCAGGEGVFLLARQTITLLLQSQAEHGCLMGSLYLDEHKEEVRRENTSAPQPNDACCSFRCWVGWLC